MQDTKAARAAVQRATKAILQSKGRQIAENGRDQVPGDVDPSTGFWSDKGKWSKPGHWLLILEEINGVVVASLPTHDSAKKIAGSINAARAIHMGLSTRVLVAVKQDGKYLLHREFEWLILFVFPDLPVNLAANDATSGDTASFNPESGELRMKEKYPQPYVIAQTLQNLRKPAALC